MITIFTIPKAFHGHTKTIQNNAIQSWTRLHPHCEIILCGDDPGTEDAAQHYKTKFLPDIARNQYGTPLLNSAFEQVKQTTTNSLLCYVNSDIILLSDFIRAIQHVRFKQFLMVGERWDVDITKLWNFESLQWEDRLRRYTTKNGVPHGPSGIDYFVFKRNHIFGQLPPFAVGRPAWDNWFIYHARKLRVPVIDASEAVMAIHQNHDFSHIPKAAGKRDGRRFLGPEAAIYKELMHDFHYFSLLNATHILTPHRVLPALRLKHIRSRWGTFPILYPRAGRVKIMLHRCLPNALERVIRRKLRRLDSN